MPRRFLLSALVCCCGLAACDRGKKESPVSNEGRAVESAIKREETPPLPKAVLDRIVKSCALVKVADQPDRPGILLAGAKGSSSSQRYLVLCDAPPDLKSVYVAYQAAGGIEKSSAKLLSTTDSGLSIFEFTTKSSVECVTPGEPEPGETLHAIRLEGEGSLSDEEKATITAELETVRNERSEMQRKVSESMRMRMERERERNRMNGRPGDPRQRPGGGMEEEAVETRSGVAALASKESKLRGRLQFPINSIKGVEIAAAETSGHALLASSTGTVRAIRREGKWVNLKDVLSSVSNRPDQVKLTVNGNRQSVRVNCSFEAFPTSQASYSMVAATTFELESQGSGSLEERLARVSPVPFDTRGTTRTITRNLEWNAAKTRLWIKVFSDDEPEKPILDEVVLLDYPDSFSARWGKPPSPLITLPAATPDTPEDLVKERHVLEAKGPIRDLVAAGDGSILMVQTTQPPYWQPLDLKTGQWAGAPWKATADTLLATQGGKIYLLSKSTGVLEIWDLASGKRDGMQLLPVEGAILAVAAPLSDPDRPVFVATDRNGWLLDPRKFEVISSGLDVESCFVPPERREGRYTRLEPGSVSLRASDDGSLYSISGKTDQANRVGVATVAITVDREAFAQVTSTENLQLPTRGRYRTRFSPDHGGSGTVLVTAATSGEFPGSSGQIRFVDASGRSEYAVMNNPPLLPAKFESPGDGLLPDRRVYLDSAKGVVLLPDGDKLHFLRVNLPDQGKGFPDFCFPGEVVEIPLPPGSGHELVTALGGEKVMGETSIKWTVPPAGNQPAGNLKLKWTGELGSPISRDFPVKIASGSPVPVAESVDGSKKIPLKRRAILPDMRNRIQGVAGSGQVLLARGEHDNPEAWNLSSGERIFSRKDYAKHFVGDAGHLYLVSNDGTLASHDLQTGKLLAEVKFGESLQGITTGMASRLPLLAAEREKHDPYLMQIHRDSLKSALTDLPKDTRMLFFMPQFKTNASGSVTWSSNTAVLRDGRAVTVKTFDQMVGDGTPDASGRYIVNSREIMDIGVTPPKQVLISSLSGMNDAADCEMDQSGRYMLLSKREEDGQWLNISVREIQSANKELFRLRLPGEYGRAPCVISDSKTLLYVIPLESGAAMGVFDFDIPAIMQQLAR